LANRPRRRCSQIDDDRPYIRTAGNVTAPFQAGGSELEWDKGKPTLAEIANQNDVVVFDAFDNRSCLPSRDQAKIEDPSGGKLGDLAWIAARKRLLQTSLFSKCRAILAVRI